MDPKKAFSTVLNSSNFYNTVKNYNNLK